MAFQYFMGKLFPIYTNEIQALEQRWSLSPEKLATILDVSTLSTEKQSEYKKVVTELGQITTSLNNISENPELYIQAGMHLAGSGSSGGIDLFWQVSTVATPFASIGALIANPTGWDQDTPEWRLILGLLTRLLITNTIFLLFITSLYFLWIRRVFAPVHIIIDRLNTYIDKARFRTISYKRNDEFAPLVSTINSLYKSLRVQENIRSNFLSDISHEIRTPITAVKCYLEAIEDGMMKLDNKTIPLLQKELTRLTSITEQIMEYEHLTSHYTDDIHVEKFFIKEQLENLIHEYTPQIERTGQHIFILGEDDVSIRMDLNMFIQIIHNIFSNFIKYAGEDTILNCNYIRHKDTIEIIFSDDGIGIPEEEINLVREKFYRVDKARTHNGNISMWIWLSIIDHITRIHDGSFTLTQNKPHWLTIILTIPR